MGDVAEAKVQIVPDCRSKHRDLNFLQTSELLYLNPKFKKMTILFKKRIWLTQIRSGWSVWGVWAGIDKANLAMALSVTIMGHG